MSCGKKLTIEEMQQLAASKGGKCLATEYKGAHIKLPWQCGYGHVWHTTPLSVKYHGSWCPKCAGRMPLTLDDMQALAATKGGRCLATEYKGALSKLTWQCRVGHTWDATPDCIRNGDTWCPKCAWAAKSLTLSEMQELAASKGGKCLATEYKGAQCKLAWQCSKGHTWKATPHNVKHHGSWCPKCAKGGTLLTLSKMQELAASKGGKCLATEYKGVNTKLPWQCSEGHTWNARPNNIKSRNSWCPKCARAAQLGAKNRQRTPDFTRHRSTLERVGYVRISSLDQNPDRQLENVPVARVFSDKASGRDPQRPELDRLLAFVREGDTVVVHSMDRIARNLDDLRHVVQSLTQRGVRIEFIKECLTFTGEDSSIDNLMLSMMGALVEFERSLLKECQREGISLAKQRGVYRGRKRSLNAKQIAEMKQRIAAGEQKAQVAREMGISRETLYQYLRESA